MERNGVFSTAPGVLAYLKSSCAYDRLYCEGGKEGWLTNSLSRPAVLARLGSALTDGAEDLPEPAVAAECRVFVRHANGSTGAQAGEHDDCVMAMAIALAVRAEFRGAQCGMSRADITRMCGHCR